MNDFPSIECPQCNMVSYNTNDIEHKYCGNCNEWHEYMNNSVPKDIKNALDAINKIMNEAKKYCPYNTCLVRNVEHHHIDRHMLTFLTPEEHERIKHNSALKQAD